MLSLKKTKAYLLQSCRVLLLITHQGSFLTTVSMRLTFQTSDSSNHSTGSIRITSIVNYIPWFWHKGYKRSAIDSTTISVNKCWDCPGMRWQLIDISHTKMNAVTKSPMSMTFPATLSAVKVAKQQNTKETAWVRTRGEGSLRMERAWNRRRCEKRKCFGMNWWRAENEKRTHGKAGHTLISFCTLVYLCVCALLDWIPQDLGGFWQCIPIMDPTEPCSHSALNCLWRYENERIALSSPSFTTYLPDFYKT